MKNIALVGGGINSIALMCFLKFLKIEFTPVFILTGLESNSLKAYMNNSAKRLDVEIVWYKPGRDYKDILKEYGNSSRIQPYCQTEIKIVGAEEYCNKFKKKVIYFPASLNISLTDDMTPISLFDSDLFHCRIVRPLLYKTKDELELFIRYYGCSPNPLYTAYECRKVTCSPCMRASRTEFDRLMQDKEINTRVNLISLLAGIPFINNNDDDDNENCIGYYSMCE